MSGLLMDCARMLTFCAWTRADGTKRVTKNTHKSKQLGIFYITLACSSCFFAILLVLARSLAEGSEIHGMECRKVNRSLYRYLESVRTGGISSYPLLSSILAFSNDVFISKSIYSIFVIYQIMYKKLRLFC